MTAGFFLSTYPGSPSRPPAPCRAASSDSLAKARAGAAVAFLRVSKTACSAAPIKEMGFPPASSSTAGSEA